jgi:hypothetical protein
VIPSIASSRPTSPTPDSFWHPRSELRHLGIFGRRWTADRAAIVDSGEAAPDDRNEDAADVRRFVLCVDREPVEPRAIGGRVLLGPAVIDAAYFRLVQDRYPAATWEADGALDPVVAFVGERAVAVIMPLRGAT